MRRVAVVVALALTALMPASAAAGGNSAAVHLESEPFSIHVGGPDSSAQGICDIQVIAYDTGVLVFPRSGNYIQSLSAIYTNPANGESAELRYGTGVFKISQRWQPDGSLIIVDTFNGLNALYHDGERTTTFAGNWPITLRVEFDNQGEVSSVTITESPTPHMGHLHPLLCELLS